MHGLPSMELFGKDWEVGWDLRFQKSTPFPDLTHIHTHTHTHTHHTTPHHTTPHFIVEKQM